MKNIKNLLLVSLLLLVGTFILTGCGSKELKMSQEEIIDTLYDGLKAGESMPEVSSVELSNDNIESYLGGKYDFVEGIASEPLMGSYAHSIVVVKLKDDADVEKAASEIENAAKETLYNKWICVSADKISVETYGHTVILIMTSEDLSDAIEKNLDKLK